MGPYIYFLIFFLIGLHYAFSDRNYYKMCAFPKYDTSLCSGIETGNSKVSCVQVVDGADCALLLKNGTVDFGLFLPEQAVLASKLVNDYTKVIAEVRYNKMSSEKVSFQMVVVVPSSFSGSFKDLKNKNYCHPGFDHAYSLTDRVLKAFERKVVPMDCFKTVSSIEEEIAYIDGFFKSACRPGPWAQDFYLDSRLKKMYPNLCKLCDSPTDCHHNTKTVGLYEAILNCLTQNGGDIAYTSYRKVQEYFGLIPGFSSKADSSSYKLLCPDETVRDLNSTTNPCAWFKQPWSLLLAKKDIAEELQPKLINWLNPDSPVPNPDIWIQPLQKLLLSSSVAVNTSLPKSLQNYFNRGVDDNSAESSCRPNVRWCITSEEEKIRCNVLKHAAISVGMKPSIECIPSKNMWNCMGHILNKDIDLMSLDTEYSYIARKVYNLSTITYEDGSRKTYYKIIAVISASGSKIKSSSDLKLKKACFPECRGLGWVSFVTMLKNLRLLKKNVCPEDFLGPSCAPGATDNRHSVMTNKQNKLCQLCNTNNNGSADCAIQLDPSDPTQSSSFYGDLGAMQCLMSVGDIAVVDYMRLSTGPNGQLDENINPNNFKVLCRNGSISSSTGLLVDDDCALSIGIKGEVVGRRDRNGVESRDTSELLLNLDKWFGTMGQSSQSILKMFGKFNSHTDGLFVEGTVSLVHKDDTSFQLVQSFSSLMALTNDECPNASATSIPSLILITSLLFSLLLQIKIFE